MKSSLKCTFLALTVIAALSGCSKKNTATTPDKNKIKTAKELSDEKKAPVVDPKPSGDTSDPAKTEPLKVEPPKEETKVDPKGQPAISGQSPAVQPAATTAAPAATGSGKIVSGPVDTKKVEAAANKPAPVTPVANPPQATPDKKAAASPKFEVQSKAVKISGSLITAELTTDSVAYQISKIIGELLLKAEIPNQESKNQKITLESIPTPALKYIFDFKSNSKKLNTFTIQEGDNKLELDFQITKGSVADLKAKNPITITLTSESWLKIVETQFRNVLTNEDMELDDAAIKFESDVIASKQVRSCILSSTSMVCNDPDFKISATLNPN